MSGCVRSNLTSITTSKASAATSGRELLSTVFVVDEAGISARVERSGATALDVRDLVIRYGDVLAVDSVSFVARHGEVTVVLGRNGAGKTSTIEACEGLRRTDGGSITVLGVDVAAADASLHARIGVMLQDGGIPPNARVDKLVRHYCLLYGRGVDAGGIIRRVGLESRAHSTWRRLSGGERQRFSLALALAARPDIAFLDEPTAGIDFDGRETVRSIIAELVETGCCVILATHDLDEAERVGHRAVVLHRGRVVLDDAIATVCRDGRRLEDVVREVTG